MLNGTYYLNGTGSRWIHLNNGKRSRVYFYAENSTKILSRSVNFYESFGNFASVNFQFNRKKVSALEYFTQDGVKYLLLSEGEDAPKI